MDKKKENLNELITPDLKHDHMEYASFSEGEGTLDEPNEEEEITSEELDALYADEEDEDDEALNMASIDSKEDEDNFIVESDDLDELDNDDGK